MTEADTTLVGLFLRADPLVKAIMVGLMVASVVSWAVIVEKAVQLGRLKRQVKAVDADFLLQSPHPGTLGNIAAAGLQEGQSLREHVGSGLTERRAHVEKAMRVALGRELQVMERYLPFLASTGSAAPFVGLFGTVWGIMNSFAAIARTNNTALSVVAPGIAEALLATGMGLMAAIPALLAYNKFATDLRVIAATSEHLIADLGGRIARQPITG